MFYKQKVAKKLVVLLPIFSSLITIITILGWVATQKTNFVQIIKFESLAKTFPPNTIQAKRFHAIAEALKKGSNNYEFTMGRVPTLGGM